MSSESNNNDPQDTTELSFLPTLIPETTPKLFDHNKFAAMASSVSVRQENMKAALLGSGDKEKLTHEKKNKNLTNTKRTIEFYKMRRLDATTGRVQGDVDIDLLIEEITAKKLALAEHALDGLNEDLFFYYQGAETDPLTQEPFYKFRIAITRENSRGGQVIRSTKEFKGYDLDGESAYMSHLIIFHDGIAGFEHNQLGAKLSALEDFITKKLSRVGFVRFKRCVSYDAIENLKQTRITTITYHVTPTTIEKFNSLETGYKLVQAQEDADASGEDPNKTQELRGLKIIKTAKVRGTLAPEAQGVMTKLAEGVTATGKEFAKILNERMKDFVTFTGPNHNAVNRQAVNLLSHHITALKIIDYAQPISHHLVDEQLAFRAIWEAYHEKLSELTKSVTLDEVTS